MRTGGGRADVRDHRELGAGARMAVDQGVKHTGPRPVADRRGNPGDGVVLVLSNIHTSMISEVSMSGNGAYWLLEENHESHVRDSLSDRPFPEGGLPLLGGKLGPHHSAMRRPSRRILSSSRRDERRC